MNINDSSEIKMNWTFALVVSVVIHVVGLGLFMLCSDSPKQADDSKAQEEVSPHTSRNTDDGNSEPDGDTAQTSTTTATSVNRTSTPAPAPASRTTQPRTATRVPAASTAGSSSHLPATSASGASSRAADTGASAPRSVASTPAAKTIVYEVKPGDNLAKIAQKHKCTKTEIIKLNKINNPNMISVGRKLKIPAPVE